MSEHQPPRHVYQVFGLSSGDPTRAKCSGDREDCARDGRLSIVCQSIGVDGWRGYIVKGEQQHYTMMIEVEEAVAMGSGDKHARTDQREACVQ